MIVLFLMTAGSAIITAVICAVMAVQELRHHSYIVKRERARLEMLMERVRREAQPQLLIREHAAAQGVDIEDLLILCGAEGWSDGERG
jgi:hypothetical protein